MNRRPLSRSVVAMRLPATWLTIAFAHLIVTFVIAFGEDRGPSSIWDWRAVVPVVAGLLTGVVGLVLPLPIGILLVVYSFVGAAERSSLVVFAAAALQLASIPVARRQRTRPAQPTRGSGPLTRWLASLGLEPSPPAVPWLLALRLTVILLALDVVLIGWLVLTLTGADPSASPAARSQQRLVTGLLLLVALGALAAVRYPAVSAVALTIGLGAIVAVDPANLGVLVAPLLLLPVVAALTIPLSRRFPADLSPLPPPQLPVGALAPDPVAELLDTPVGPAPRPVPPWGEEGA